MRLCWLDKALLESQHRVLVLASNEVSVGLLGSTLQITKQFNMTDLTLVRP